MADLLDWAAEEDALFKLLYPQVLKAAQAGAANGVLAGVTVDWALVNRDVQAWAKEYTGDLVTGITATTKAATQAAVSAWIESGEPLDDLLKALAPIFGDERAKMIGVTEVTRAFAAGNQKVWKETGATGMMWMTVQDELVCEICGDLQGKSVGIDDDFEWHGTLEGQKKPVDFAGIPPSHPRCRCYLQPKIEAPHG